MWTKQTSGLKGVASCAHEQKYRAFFLCVNCTQFLRRCKSAYLLSHWNDNWIRWNGFWKSKCFFCVWLFLIVWI